jgi:hypothetical protein
VAHHPSGQSGPVNAKGELVLELPAKVNPKVKIRHTIKLAGNSGTGTYRAIGGLCIGTTALQRPAAPAAAAPAR